MAGGGVKAGFAYGETDDFGYHATENRMHIHDFHATTLALLGLDHERLTYKYSGRDFRLTDVAGSVTRVSSLEPLQRPSPNSQGIRESPVTQTPRGAVESTMLREPIRTEIVKFRVPESGSPRLPLQ